MGPPLTQDHLCLLTEFCPQGDLSKFIKSRAGRIGEALVMKIFAQICAGLEYIHRQRILHRDIKSHNIFLMKHLVVRIGDFGVAKRLAREVNFAETLVGTPFYVSPEICAKRGYGFKSDVWGLGCVLYEMCVGSVPFKSRRTKELYTKIQRGRTGPSGKG